MVDKKAVYDAIRSITERAPYIFEEQDILLMMILSNQTIMLRLYWTDARGKTLFKTCEISWLQIEAARDPKGMINDTLDTQIELLLRRKEEIAGDGTADAVAPYLCRPAVPVWERGNG